MQIPISRESICLDGGGLVLLPMPPSPPQRANKQQGPSGEVEEGPGLNVTSRGGGIDLFFVLSPGDTLTLKALPDTIHFYF